MAIQPIPAERQGDTKADQNQRQLYGALKAPWRSGKIQRSPQSAALSLNLLLQQGNGVDQLLGARRATGNIDIYWNHLVNTLNQRIVVEHPTRGGACSH